MSIYAYNGKQYGVPVGHGHDRLLVQQGAVREGRHHARRRRPGTSTSPPSRSSRTAASPRSPSRARTSGRRCTSGRTSSSASAASDALQQMIQTGDWNTDACTKAGDEVARSSTPSSRTRTATRAPTYDDEAAAVGNGKAAMELMGQWAPWRPGRPDSTSKKGLGDDLGWFAFPAVDRRRGRRHRRRRRRQRDRRRQERAARGGRLPQVLQQRRERQLAQQLDAADRAVAGHRHRGHRHRPEPAGRPRRPRTRPSFIQLYLDQATSPALGHGDQRGDDRAVPRPVRPGEGLPGHHGRGGARSSVVAPSDHR